ncbi:MAG: branched-chain amino acid ABC transporter permease [Deltaproteobacteria bacterium]|jgi:branched-chain amino acid transport system permease protein|nr:branched-chain amino acid ABC transporter permease [Deltaproteobacteria bacterium]MBT4641177.1 branched-chain amino acid ABC transporter permease [Deltaproteobacteria bacterium]MBT6498284.1 branched-chain amino acid ABC transporter permease [Deltaproteobacteria bacterium]MBT6610610.1 branched-chain amino acid ABC transporter permease [Deltaproteobacteria bacterium]MBT7153324.1 branched-chain amino acid ABC transporter permease [Deltaproteobacteria bacterium]
MTKKLTWIFWIVLLVFLLAYPFLFGAYYTNVVVIFGIMSLFALTVNLLLGFTGLLSFGHAMFFGVGAYATALSLTHIEGLPLLVSILIGIAASAVFALILCPILVRASGTAFTMLTLAFGMLMYTLSLKLRDITGGEDGIGGFPTPDFSIPGVVSFDMTDPLNFYYFALVVLLVSMWALWFLTKTPFGTVIIAIRDNSMRVNYMGFRVTHTKALVLVVSSSFAGVAGAVYALFQNLVSSDGVFSILTSFAPLIMTVIGGVGSFFGPIWGAGIMMLLEEVVTLYTDRFSLVSGIVLILVVMFAPSGVVGMMRIVKAKWLLRRQKI